MAKKQGLNNRQWLNIISIAIAFMVLLFTLVGKIFKEQNEFDRRPFASIQGIRIGDWQAQVDEHLNCSQEPQALTFQQCRQLFLAWRNLIASPDRLFDQAYANDDTSLIINIKSEIWQEYAFRLAPHPHLVDVNREIAFSISDTSVRQLFPSSLLSYLSQQ